MRLRKKEIKIPKNINQIIEELSKKKEIIRLTKKVLEYNPHQDERDDDLLDLQQDIMLQLLENPSRYEKIYNDGCLSFFIFRVIQNNIISSTSPYHKKYRFLRTHSEDIPQDNNDDEETDD